MSMRSKQIALTKSRQKSGKTCCNFFKFFRLPRPSHFHSLKVLARNAAVMD